ncbi:MAG: hypothetical protein IKW80_07080 [Thermoguttaceae bacterium]|nr:hypothetical protein [Thermoguttaceae bacterium]
MSSETTTPTEKTPSTDAVKRLMNRLRGITRRRALTYGFTKLVVELGLWFFATLILDKMFEPSPVIRGIVLAASAVWFIYRIVVYIIRPMFRPISDESMAALCAVTFPEESELILTAVHPADPEGQDPQLWTQTVEKANALADQLLRSGRLRAAFDNKRSFRGWFKAIALVAAVVGLHYYNSMYLPVWFSRVICLSSDLWPRQARIWVDGFAEDANNPIGRIKIARGDDLDLRVWADADRPLVPKRVTMDYRDSNGVHRYATMVRQGAVNETEQPASKPDNASADSHSAPLSFTFTLRGVLNPLTINFRGADVQLRGLYIDVVESPVIVKAQLRLTYPKYMNKKDRVVNVSDSTQIPFGTKATLVLTPNKPLQSVTAQLTAVDGSKTSPAVTFIKSSDASQPDSFQLDLGELTSELSASFSLLDEDNLKSRKDASFAFSILPDAVPSPALAAKGMGVACTIDAIIPISGTITDDYGVSFARFAYTITRRGEKLTGTIPIADWADRPLDVKVNTTFEPVKADVLLDDSISLCIETGDGYDLPEERNPNVAQTPTTTLEIVTPQRMRTILEATELNLRRHFETVFDEVKTTRDLFNSISIQKEEQKNESEGEGDSASFTPTVPVAVRLLHADRAVQNARKNMQEFLAEAESFEDLVDQMVNNHIDTPEWKSRLHDGIAVPLTKIANESFTELEKRLIKFRTAMESDDWSALPGLKTAAATQFESVVVQLDAVLAKMLQMEDFNEAIEELRSIIKKQEKMEDDMKAKQKESLEDLL